NRNTQENPPVHGLWMDFQGTSQNGMPGAVGTAPPVPERLRPSSSGLRTARPARPNPPRDGMDGAPVPARRGRSASEKTRRDDRRQGRAPQAAILLRERYPTRRWHLQTRLQSTLADRGTGGKTPPSGARPFARPRTECPPA